MVKLLPGKIKRKKMYVVGQRDIKINLLIKKKGRAVKL